MRAREFVKEAAPSPTAPQVEQPTPGYYLVGDSHTKGMGVADTVRKYRPDYIGWQDLSQTGAHVHDPAHHETLKKIPAGSVVTISLGQNDLTNPKQSVEHLQRLVTASQQQGHQPVVLLPTQGQSYGKQRDAIRSQMQKSLTVPMLDLGPAPSKKQKGDDVHLPFDQYHQMSKNITGMFKPGKPVVPTALPSNNTIQKTK
jgi:hypothetical protein